MQFRRTAVVLAALAATAPSWATGYAFEVLYLGNGQAEVVPGSTDPRTVTLQAGDTFTWGISAQLGYRWSVLTGGDVFPFMALGVNESANRTSDHVLTVSYQGATTLLQDWTGDIQSLVHMGTNTVTLPTGLVFDRLLLDYTLLSAAGVETVEDPDNPGSLIDVDIGPVGTTPTGLLPIFGMVDVAKVANSSFTVYAPVPEPAVWALWLAGLAATGAAVRRRRA